MIIKLILVLILALIITACVGNSAKPKQLGIVNGKLAQLPKSPNAVSSQTEVQDKKVAPLFFIGTKENSYQKIIMVLESIDNAEILTQQEDYIHVVFTTKIFRFKDDVEFYFDSSEKVIHYRSASRVGYSDMGLNKKRYEIIKAKYNK